MGTYVLRVEGVNFANCLFDTNDLSVIRGASLLLDQIAHPLGNAIAQVLGQRISPNWSGGSKAVFRFQTDAATAAQIEAAARNSLTLDPWKHMTFVLDMVEDDTSGRAEMVAEARNRTRQFRQWTVADCAVSGAWRQDSLDGRRPADPRCSDTKGPLSPASSARRTYGRQMRKGVFAKLSAQVLPERVRFCESFEDLVSNPPSELSISARSKMAVIHLDGDGFGAAAAALNDPVRFASEIAERTDLILAALVKDALAQEAADGRNLDPVLRMEVLVWGGDDITLVVPAWRVISTLKAFFAASADWAICGKPLGFTGGAIVASYKAPVRRLVQLAGEAVDLAKASGTRGSCTVDIFESASPPEDGLSAHRARVWGSASAADLALPGDRLGALVQVLARWRGEAGRLYPSRARLYSLLSSGMPEADLLTALGRDEVRVLGVARDEAGDLIDDLRLPSHGNARRSVMTDLRLVCDLWDYAWGTA